MVGIVLGGVERVKIGSFVFFGAFLKAMPGRQKRRWIP
jgi:hypothetical protein